MANGGQINYSIGFNVDYSGLNQLKTSLQQIQQMTGYDFMKINGIKDVGIADQQLKKIKTTIKSVEVALEKAFNTDLGSVNITKFNQLLNQSKINVNDVYGACSKLGAAGQTAFRGMTGQLLTTNTQLKQTHSLIETMSITMKNTLKWGAASSVMNSFTNNIQQAYGYVKHLDTSLNDIRIVTGKSADEMGRFAKVANDSAKALGQSTTAYTEASLIYYQQGLEDREAQARAETTLKAANVTGQTGREVSEQLTAVWNGYKVSAAETELYVDKLAAVAASTASDLEELSTGMSKVASAASTSGVDIDQLNATLSTVISVTRQAPETVGTAFKTIYARLGDLAVDGVDEFGTSLGQISSKMKTMGIEILDETGNMREMGTVVEEVAAKWDTWTSAQKQAAAVAMAGKRQYNNLIALFENWDMYEDALLTSANAAGTLQNQQDIYMESTAAHLATLKASVEDIWDSLIDTSGINAVIDGITLITDGMGTFIDSIGGSAGALLMLSSAALGVFGKDISVGIAKSIANMDAYMESVHKTNAEMAIMREYNKTTINDEGTQKMIGMKQQMLQINDYLNEQEREMGNQFIKNTQNLYDERDAIQARVDAAKDSYKRETGEDFDSSFNMEKLRTELESSANDFDRFYKKGGSGIEKLSQKWKAYGRAIEASDDLYSPETLKAQQDYIDAIGSGEKNIDNFTQRVETLLDSGRLEEEQRSKLQKSYDNYLNSLSEGDGTLKDNTKSLGKLVDVESAYNEAVKTTSNVLHTQTEDLKNLDSAINANTAAIQNNEAEQARWYRQKQTEIQVQNYVNATQGLTMLTAGVVSAYSAFKALGDESLSSGEKLIQFSMGITTAVSSIGMGLLQITASIAQIKASREAYKATIAAQGKHTVATVKNSGAVKTNTGTTIKNSSARIKSKTAIDAETAALQKNTIAKLANNKAFAGPKMKEGVAGPKMKGSLNFKKGPTLKKQDTQGFGALLDGLDTKLKNNKVIGGVLSKAGKGAGGAGLLNGFGKLPAAVLGLTRIVTVAGAASLAIWGISQALDAHNIKAEKAAEKAQEMGQRYAASKANYDTFSASIENYDTAIEGLKGLVKGTEEYEAQVQSANDAALELLNTVDGLQADYSGDVITFKETKDGKDALGEIESQRRQALATDQKMLYDAQNKATEASIHAEVVDLYREIGSLTMTSTTDKGQPDITSRQEFELAIQDLSKVMNDQDISFKDAVKDLKLDNPALENALIDNKDKISELVFSNQDLINSQDVLNQTITKAFLEDNPEYSGKTEAEKDYLSGQIGSELNMDNTEYATAYNESKWLQKTNFYGRVATQTGASDEEIAQEYAHQHNLEYKGSAGLGGKAKFEDSDGDIVKYTISEMSKYLAEKDAAEAVTSQDSKTFNAYAEQMGEAQNLANLLWGDMENSFNQEGVYNDILEFISSGENWDEFLGGAQYSEKEISGMTQKAQNLTEKDVKNIDLSKTEYDSYDALIKAIQEAFNGANSEEAKEKRKENALERSESSIDAAVEAEGFDKGELEEHRDLLLENEEALKGNIEAATELAIIQKKQQRGMDNLCENWEDYNSILRDSEASYADQSKASKGVLDSLKDLYDLTEEELEMLPANFVKDNLDKIEAVKNGVDGAYEDLLAEIGKEIVLDLKLRPGAEEQLLNHIDGIMNVVDTKDLEFGATLNDTNYTETLNNMILNGQATAADISAALAGVQFDPKITFREVPIEDFTSDDQTTTWDVIDPITGEVTTATAKNIHKFQQNGKVKIPVIDGSNTTYKGSGGGLKPSKSSGGGGGGGSSTSKKTYKTTEKKRDRYREVNNSLSKLSTELDRLAEKQEKLFGKDLLDNLNKQLDVLEQQKKVTQEKLAIAQKEAKEMRKSTTDERKGYYNDLKDFGITFDSEGNIENYQEKMKALDDKIARRNKYFNSKSAKWQSSKKGEKYDKKTARLEANRDTLEDLKEKYDTLLYDTIPGLVDEMTQVAYSQIEIKLEAFQIEADLRLDVTEARSDWADFEAELAELQFPDDLTKQLQPTIDFLNAELGDVTETTLIDGTTATMTKTADALYHEITTLTKDWQQWRELGPEGYTGQFSATKENGEIVYDEATVRELIEENIETLQEEVLRIEEAFETIHEGYLDSIDAVIEGLDEELEVLEYIGNQLEHNVRMTELLKGENAYEDMAKNYAAQRINNKNILAEYEQRMTFLRQEIANTTDKDAKKVLEEEYRNTLENYEEALESAAELIQTEFENAVNLQLQKFDEALGTLNSNGDAIGTMGIKTQWEIDTNNAEKYLDTVEKTFGIQDFANKVKTSIADTNSISAQKKLNNLLDDQLEKLREKDKLTQYDLDRANALYEIELKKIALEEAQNNKSQMRLRRDASGNYSYQFVADQDGVAQAQQELLEAQNNLYSLDKDTMKERQQELWDVYQEYQDLMIEYSQLSAEEREKYEDIYAAKFADIQSRMTNLGAECADIQINLAESAAATMAQAYEDMGKGIDYTLEEIVPKWATGMDEMIAKINAPDGSFIAAMNETFKEIKTLGEQAATDMKAIGQKSAAAYTAANEEAKKWQKSAEATTKELTTQYDKLKAMNDEAVKHRDFWKEIEANIVAAAKAANDYNIAATGGEADEIQGDRTSDEGGTGGTAGDAGTGGTAGGTGTGSGKKELTTQRKKGIAEAIVRLDNFGGWGKGNTRKNRINKKFKKVNDKTAYSVVQDYVNKLLSGAVENSFTKKQLKNNYKYSHFDTGGYTGDWSGDMGKMAVLHKKELILNAKDTVNILEAVKLLRTFADDYYKVQKEINSSSNNNSTTSTPIIENLAAMMTSAIALNMNKMISSFEPVSKSIKDLTTEEKSDIINIEINADFPNANSAKEIEKAFLELTNIATQRAYSTKR